jgi:hypothetical protein
VKNIYNIYNSMIDVLNYTINGYPVLIYTLMFASAGILTYATVYSGASLGLSDSPGAPAPGAPVAAAPAVAAAPVAAAPEPVAAVVAAVIPGEPVPTVAESASEEPLPQAAVDDGVPGTASTGLIAGANFGRP